MTSRAGSSLALLLALAAAIPQPLAAQRMAGPNPQTIDQSGGRRPFHAVAGGQATVLHFMFPSCQSFCPLSGEVLSRTQTILAKSPPAKPFRIVSVSILPRETTPARLTGWLRRHRAKPGWVALYVGPRDIGGLMRYYGETAVDVQLHSSQILVLDRSGRLVKRFDDLPEPAKLAAAVRIAAR